MLPGGADLPYVQKLQGQDNDAIRHYVQDGGSFLGICARSYYASSYVAFDQGGPLKVLGDTKNCLFLKATLWGLSLSYDYTTQKSSMAIKIYTIFPDIPETTVFYNGSRFFKDAEQYSDTTVIARYDNHLPAVISINHGKGKVVLSAVHFEYDPFLLDPYNPDIQKITPSLRYADPSRKTFKDHLMHLLRGPPSSI